MKICMEKLHLTVNNEGLLMNGKEYVDKYFTKEQLINEL